MIVTEVSHDLLRDMAAWTPGPSPYVPSERDHNFALRLIFANREQCFVVSRGELFLETPSRLIYQRWPAGGTPQKVVVWPLVAIQSYEIEFLR